VSSGRADVLGTSYGLRRLSEPRFQLVIVILLLVLVLAFRVLQFALFTQQIQWGYDFSAYWTAAGDVLNGRPIYQAQQLLGTYSPQQQYLYLYPPFLAVVVTPLAAAFPTDYRAAMWVWAFIGAVIVALVAVGIARLERLPSDGRRLVWVGAAFAFPPVVGELVMGNVHVLVLGLLALSWWGIRLANRGDSRGQILAGVAVGVASLIKVFPALIVVWLVLTGRTRAALWSVIAFAVLAAVTLPVTGLQPWLDYPRVLANLGPPVDVYDTLAPAVWVGSLVGAPIARVAVVLLIVGVLAWAARRLDDGAGFALAVTGSIAIAPALYHHYLAILVLPLLLAVRHTKRPALLLIPYLAMFAGDQPALGDLAWIVNRAIPSLGLVALLVLLVADGLPRMALTLDRAGRAWSRA
jgi:alpha-1,2-mannosyltransferase